MSRGLRQGDVVEVRPLEAIRATLDEAGCLDGLPFMTEMAALCGRRVRVQARADRVCVEGGCEKRRMRDAVFLEDLRCDGAAHGGCQRGCMVFWKEAWLINTTTAAGPEQASCSATNTTTDVGPRTSDHRGSATSPRPESVEGRTLEPDTPSPRYTCQSTRLMAATEPFGRWDPARYLADVACGNLTLAGFAVRVLRALRGRLATALGRAPWTGNVAGRTPSEHLGLQPGDLVRIRTRQEIVATLDRHGRNRGLEIEPAMFDRCGERHQVLGRVDRIILEQTGELRPMKDTVALTSVTCDRCARANRLYWREIWLKPAER